LNRDTVFMTAALCLASFIGGYSLVNQQEKRHWQSLQEQNNRMTEFEARKVNENNIKLYQQNIQRLAESYNSLINGKLALCQSIIVEKAGRENKRILEKYK